MINSDLSITVNVNPGPETFGWQVTNSSSFIKLNDMVFGKKISDGKSYLYPWIKSEFDSSTYPEHIFLQLLKNLKNHVKYKIFNIFIFRDDPENLYETLAKE